MRSKYRRPIIIVLAILIGLPVVLGIAGVLFIKFNTSAAADFTDNVLRPLIGDERVLKLEKIFFNASDYAEKAKYKNKAIDAPQFDQNTVPTPSGQVEQKAGLSLQKISSVTSFPPIKGEGEWVNQDIAYFPGKEVAAHTFVRPDPDRNFAKVVMLKIAMSSLRL